MRSVGGLFPGNEFQSECRFVRDTAVKALFGQDTQLDFCHVKPRTMRGGVMKAEPSGNPVSLNFAKDFDQRQIGMGVEVIQDHINTVSLGIQDIHQIAHGKSELAFGATAGDQDMPLSSFGFSKDKHVARAVALIFMVLSAWVTRSHGKARAASV